MPGNPSPGRGGVRPVLSDGHCVVEDCGGGVGILGVGSSALRIRNDQPRFCATTCVSWVKQSYRHFVATSHIMKSNGIWCVVFSCLALLDPRSEILIKPMVIRLIR